MLIVLSVTTPKGCNIWKRYPTEKKTSTELPPIRFKYYSLQTEKMEEISFYDYYGYLENFGFEWEDKSLTSKYTVELHKTKIIKKISMVKTTR